MSDGIKSWHEDMDDYVSLCHHFNEKIQYTNGGLYPAALSRHHEDLRAAYLEEQRQLTLPLVTVLPRENGVMFWFAPYQMSLPL